MLCTLNEVLKHAQKKHYAVCAFDFVTDIYLKAILDTCEEMKAPVILSALEHDLQGKGLAYISGTIKAIQNHYSIPIVLHLDHGKDLNLLKRCIDYGFSSVMYDSSEYPLKENINRTKEVITYAHARGVTVEAELGYVAGTDIMGGDTGDSKLTDPKEVEEFVEKTDVDALAVSIGTAHGIYKSKPKLDIECLKSIRSITDVPLVLHGGSGTPEDQLKEAIKEGICKLNIYADLRIAMNSKINECVNILSNRKDELPDNLFKPLYMGLSNEVLNKIKLTSSNNRY